MIRPTGASGSRTVPALPTRRLCPVAGISRLGRPAKGVKVINLNKGDSLVDVALIAGEKDNGEENGGAGEAEAADKGEAGADAPESEEESGSEE